jgi:hypothetical protein
MAAYLEATVVEMMDVEALFGLSLSCAAVAGTDSDISVCSIKQYILISKSSMIIPAGFTGGSIYN